jgi:Domain of unknown function (DUF222)
VFDSAVATIGPALAGQLAAVHLDKVGDDGLIEALAKAEKLARWATAAQLAVISELARRRPDPQFVQDEIAAELRLSRVAAATRLGLALDLDRLPQVGDAMATGRLDLPKATAITDAVAVLEPPAATAVTDQAVEQAERHTVGELRGWLRRTVLSADPAAADRRHAQAVSERRVTVTPVDDGMAELWALLPADDAARVYAAVDSCARASAADQQSDSADHGRTADQRRADALVDLVTGRIAPPTSRVQVTVPLATLAQAADEPGELAGIGPIPAGMARRLAADGVWRWLLTGESGAVVDAGRHSYRPPAGLARLIRGRDVTCRFPGCRQPAHRCDLDHTVPYPAGPTSAANLAVLCRHHHLLKHRAGWTVRQRPDGGLTWISPGGRSYSTSPPPRQ